MTGWFRGRRRGPDMERELRAARPQASEQFVKALAARMSTRPARPTRARTRLVVAGVATAALAAVLGATGGFSSAASSVAGVTHGVAYVTGVTASPSSSLVSAPVRPYSTGPTPAADQYAVAPTITDFMPSYGAPGASVEVEGTNFTGESAITDVTLSGTEVSFTVDSTTTLHFVVPEAATSGKISLTNGAGTATSTGSFTVVVAPSITSLDNNEGGAGTPVVITGSGFTGTTKVTFSGAAAEYEVVSDTEIDTSVPAKAKPGAGEVEVTNPAGSVSTGYTVDSGAPVVSRFSPTSGKEGDTITITGSHLDTVSGVDFNGTPSTAVTPVSSSQVQATVPAGATSGPISVTTDVGTGTSRTDFTVIGAPQVDDFSPTYGKAGATVTITGSSFTGTTEVDFNGQAADRVTVRHDDTIVVKVPDGATTGKITVRNGVGPGQTSGDFTVLTAPPSPVTVDPNEAGAGTLLTIDGSGLVGVTSVRVLNAPASFEVVSSTRILTTVPATAKPGSGVITLKNAVGSATVDFTVDSGAPTLTRFSPTSGKAGDVVTLTGKAMDTVTAVLFDGTDASSSIVHVSATELTVAVPTDAATGPIEIANAVGSSASKQSFVVLDTPTIAAFSPAYGRAGTKVTVYGDHFTGATEVDFNGTPARGKPAVSKDGSSLSAVVPAGATSGPITVKVGTLSGDSGNDGFVVEQKPTVDDAPFTPTEAVAGEDVQITGSNLTGVTKVKFGSQTSPFVHVDSDGQVTAEVPDGATSTKVSVTNAAGTATSKATLLITAMKAFAPTSGVVGKTITITGTHLAAATAVAFNGAAATVTFNSDTKIVTTVPDGATTGPITVETAAGIATSPKSFTVILPPAIASVPANAKIGTWIAVDGSNFVFVKKVVVGGRAARFRVRSTTELEALVPSGAKSGRVTVTNPAGTAQSGSSVTVVRR